MQKLPSIAYWFHPGSRLHHNIVSRYKWGHSVNKPSFSQESAGSELGFGLVEFGLLSLGRFRV